MLIVICGVIFATLLAIISLLAYTALLLLLQATMSSPGVTNNLTWYSDMGATMWVKLEVFMHLESLYNMACNIFNSSIRFLQMDGGT